MTSCFCFHSSHSSIYTEELHCSCCNNEESGTMVTENFYPPMPEPGNSSPGYYVPSADANTQTEDEDFMLFEPTRDANTQTVEEDFIYHVATREASTQTTEDDFNLVAQMSGRIGHENYGEKNCYFHEQTSRDFDQDSAANRNLPSISKYAHENALTAKAAAEPTAIAAHDISKKKCGKCKKRFLIESKFYAHIQNNCDPNPFHCDKCYRKFSYEEFLTDHQGVHTGKKQYKCRLCDYASSWRKSIRSHMTAHRISYLRQYYRT